MIGTGRDERVKRKDAGKVKARERKRNGLRDEKGFHPQTRSFAYGNRQRNQKPKEIPFVAWV